MIQTPSDVQTVTLVDPSLQYRDSYIDMIKEHQQEGRFIDSRHIDNDARRLAQDFDRFIDSLRAGADPERVRKGAVRENFYWLIVDGEVVGRTQLRHELSNAPHQRDLGHIGFDIRPSRMKRGLGTTALRLTLERARATGMKKILITCDSWNEASRRIIERNGGIFESAVQLPGRAYQRLRYWIEI